MKIKINHKPGVASIPTIMVLMILILSAGALIASISISDNISVSDTNNSDKALNYAQLGAKDALERIVRNKDYSGSYSIDVTSGGCSSPYQACSSVLIDSGVSPKIINVEGRVRDIKRKIQVNVNLDDNGLITGYSWQEL